MKKILILALSLMGVSALNAGRYNIHNNLQRIAYVVIEFNKLGKSDVKVQIDPGQSRSIDEGCIKKISAKNLISGIWADPRDDLSGCKGDIYIEPVNIGNVDVDQPVQILFKESGASFAS